MSPAAASAQRTAKAALGRRKGRGEVEKRRKAWLWVAVGLAGVVLASYLPELGVVPSWLLPGSDSQPTGSGGARPRGAPKKTRRKPVNLERSLERSARAIQQRDYEGAAKVAGKAAEDHPDSWPAWLNLGIARRLGDGALGVEPAVAAFKRAAELEPKSPDIHAYLASALSCTSRLHEAKSAAFKALSLSPDRVDALVIASRLTNFTDDLSAASEALMDKISRLLAASENLTVAEETHLRFAMFKALDQQEKFSSASEHLSTANGLRSAAIFAQLQVNAAAERMVASAANGDDQDPSEEDEEVLAPWGKESIAALMLELIQGFPPLSEEAKAEAAQGHPEVSEAYCHRLQPAASPGHGLPLLLVGLPRSGSTLLQQMLAAHPEIQAGDEYTFLASDIQDTIHRRLPEGGTVGEQIESLSSDLDAAGEQIHKKYLKQLFDEGSAEAAYKALSQGKSTAEAKLGKYVIDKQMSNAWWLGLAPPCAKIVVVERSDMDVGFSNFKTHFSSSGYEFSYNQTELGWRIVLTNRMLAWWKDVLPPHMITTVRYEDIVEAPEATLRTVFSFLGLPFAPESLEFHSREAAITSASAVQLRRPLTQTHMDHWQHYASALEELMRSMAVARGFLLYHGLLEEVEGDFDLSQQGTAEEDNDDGPAGAGAWEGDEGRGSTQQDGDGDAA